MTKVQLTLTQHELWLVVSALEAKADEALDGQRRILDHGERHDIEEEECECRELQERLEALRDKPTAEDE